MKNKILIILFLVSTTLFAGFGYNSIYDVNIYDINTGLYYKSITKKPKDSGFSIIKSSQNMFTCNINIYNPKTKKSVTIFKDNSKNIIDFLFEMKFKKDSIVYFNINNNIKNNNNIQNRQIKDKLLISTYDRGKQETTLWSCKKNGRFKIESYDW